MPRKKIYDPSELSQYKENQLIRTPQGIFVDVPQDEYVFTPDYEKEVGRRYGIDDLTKQQEAATKSYQEGMLNKNLFIDELKKALRGDKTTQGLRKQQLGFQEKLATAPYEKVDYAGDDPFERARLRAAREGSLERGYNEFNDILKQRGATLDDVLGRGQAGYETQLMGKQFALEDIGKRLGTAQTNLSDFLGTTRKSVQEKLQREFDAQQAAEKRQQSLEDYLYKKQIDAQFKSQKSSDGNKDKVTQADKTDYNTSLNNFAQYVVTSTNPDPNLSQFTREQVIDELAKAYPWKSRKEITNDVYNSYGDNFR